MRRACVVILVLAAGAGILWGQGRASTVTPWSFTVSPSLTLPLVMGDFSSEQYFDTAYGGSLAVEYSLGPSSPLSITAAAGGSAGGFLPVDGITVSGTLGELEVLAGLAALWRASPLLAFRAFADGGAGYSWILSSSGGAYGVVRAGGGVQLSFTDSWGLSLDAAWTQKFSLYGGLSVGLGTVYRLQDARAVTPTQVPAERPRPLSITAVESGSVFPLFRSYYDTHQLGTVTIANKGSAAVESVHVGFLIRQYMDGAKECAVVPRIEPGASVQVPLYALFNDKILDVTEGTKVIAEVTLEYGEGLTASKTTSILVYDRNAMTWDDDRHAAAFVSSKDPWVRDLSGNFLADVKDALNPELPRNLQVAAAVHEGLRAFGMSYVMSPNRPFLKEGGDLSVVDTLNFPRQTLGYRAGDCADFSVLYASCLEAAGIETAFITVPGHILMAFDLGLTAAQARARAMDLTQLVIVDDRAWIPLETTMRDADTLGIWRKAAEEWREASADGSEAFYPVHEAWQTFPPVGLPADGTNVTVPSAATVRSAFTPVLARLVDVELNARLAAQGKAQAGEPKSAAALNERGVLLAKYGRFTEAESALKQAVTGGSQPAVINLGNVALLRGDAAAAYELFQQASRKNPKDARVFISMARAAAQLGRTADVQSALQSANTLNPELAAQYASLSETSGSGTRAAEASAVDVIWY